MDYVKQFNKHCISLCRFAYLKEIWKTGNIISESLEATAISLSERKIGEYVAAQKKKNGEYDLDLGWRESHATSPLIQLQGINWKQGSLPSF